MNKNLITGEEKKMYGQYVREIEDKGKSNTWKWLRKGNLKDAMRL